MTPEPQAKAVGDIAWSHSALNDYENCPHKYMRTKVAKDVQQDFSGPALEWGNEVHEAMEHYLRSGAMMPANTRQYQKYADKVLALRDVGHMRMEVEEEICLNAAWEPVSWFSKQAFFRAKADVALYNENGGFAVNVDWKTNKKYYGTNGQDQRNAAAIMLWNPRVQVVETWFQYVGIDKLVTRRYTRPQLGQLLAPSLQLVQAIARSYQTAVWPKKPTGLCKFCPVLDCENNPSK